MNASNVEWLKVLAEKLEKIELGYRDASPPRGCEDKFWNGDRILVELIEELDEKIRSIETLNQLDIT